jgi:hypothetical protein
MTVITQRYKNYTLRYYTLLYTAQLYVTVRYSETTLTLL